MWFSRQRESAPTQAGAQLAGRDRMIGALQRLKIVHEPSIPAQPAQASIPARRRRAGARLCPIRHWMSGSLRRCRCRNLRAERHARAVNKGCKLSRRDRFRSRLFLHTVLTRLSGSSCSNTEQDRRTAGPASARSRGARGRLIAARSRSSFLDSASPRRLRQLRSVTRSARWPGAGSGASRSAVAEYPCHRAYSVQRLGVRHLVGHQQHRNTFGHALRAGFQQARREAPVVAAQTDGRRV